MLVKKKSYEMSYQFKCVNKKQMYLGLNLKHAAKLTSVPKYIQL